jgi:hypothetical protein
MKIEDRIAEWCGELKIKTDDETDFILKPRLEHKRKLMFLQKKFDDGSYSEDDVATQDSILLGIVKESYPHFNQVQLEQVVQLYGTELLIELYCAWKWRDREAIEAFKKKQKEKISEVLNG